jgi:NAD(P)-dependent dehydrogenase (short-subunit alcohol dehydrogenase family)
MAKKVLITGGSRGIGQATAELLIQSGYQVLAPGSRELDVSNQESVDKFFAENFTEDSSLYALICNAGVYHSAPLTEHSLEEWQKVIDVNLTGAFRLCKKSLPYLQAQQGAHIVMVSSVSAEGDIYTPAYSASKAGMIGLMKSLTWELGKFGINVNAVAPGWVRTDMAQTILNTPEQEKNNLGANVQNRWIEPSEIAHLIQYLISPSARAITGETITISAGL